MSRMNNVDIIKSVAKEMTADLRPMVEGKSSPELLAVFEDYPNVKNGFINTLTNKVTKTLIYSKIYSNPLKELKKGLLEYGDSIEELFVQMAMAKNFGEHWNNDGFPGTPEADLIRKLKPKVTALYISVNFDKKYKTTVMDKQLRKAFINEYGLSNLVMQIVGSLTSQAEYQEYLATRNIVTNLVETATNMSINSDSTTETLTSIPKGTVIKQTPKCVKVTDAKTLIQGIRESVGNLRFPTTDYNLAKELNWSRPEDLILITTPSVIADIDVNVLAGAFNVSMTDIKTRTIEVDKLPSGIFSTGATVSDTPTPVTSASTLDKVDAEILGIMIDRELLQIWDTFQGASTFYNPEGQYTNHFASREGIFAVCCFANMVVFYK